jgi:hypothetical protein
VSSAGSALRAATDYADPGRFVESVVLVVDGGRTQVQFTGHPKAEIAGLAFGVSRFEIADMTYPGGFFHFTLSGTVRHL